MEKWKSVKGYEGYYEVSNLGQVRSVDRLLPHNRVESRLQPGKLLKGEVTYQGYKRVRLSKFSKTKKFNVHRLVAEAFIGDYPSGKVINHIDEDKANNKVENLEYITQKENINHGSSMKRRSASQSISVKGTNIKTGEVVFYPSMAEAERSSGGYFYNTCISRVCRGDLKSHRGFVWEKVNNNEK